MPSASFAKYAWGVLGYNLAVILWGAFVRISYSGDGCGDHWPLCNGQFIPLAPDTKMLVELSHRLTSGIALFMVVGLVVWARKLFERHHPARKAALFSLVIILLEALFGAVLVKYGLVNKNASVGRAVIMMVHLVNTFLLVGGLALTAWWARSSKSVRFQAPKKEVLLFGTALFALILVGMTGAIAALGNTLFPSESFAHGFKQDFSSTSHFLLRLRVAHPIVAVLTSLYLISIIWKKTRHSERSGSPVILRNMLTFVIGVQLLAGFLNVFLLGPTWLQLTHLLLADSVWILFILFGETVLTVRHISSLSDQEVPPAVIPDTSFVDPV